MVIDNTDGETWWWCSRECKRLDDKDDPDAWWHDFVDPEPSEDPDVTDEESEVEEPTPPVNPKPTVTGTSAEPPKRTQAFCRNKLSKHPDEPGCQQKGGDGPFALIACGYKLCRYERFCRKCADGLDAKGNPTDDKRAPLKKKGVKVADDDDEEGFRCYCSKECQKEIKRRKDEAKAKAKAESKAAGTEQAVEGEKVTAANTEDARAKAAEAAKKRDEREKKQEKAKLKQTRLTMSRK
ncbi:hypothetical protein E2P81_ATG10747 [Venturia nashicola]|nr:hypothetical protein E2P81_ATG10747 [Venturia nashicola]